MYISIGNLVIFSIFGTLYLIGMYVYAKQCGRIWYKKYEELNERHIKLQKKYEALCLELNEPKNISEDNDNSFNRKNDKKQQHCQICNSTEKVRFYPTAGYIKNENGQTFLSGGFYMCDNCLNACERCCKCGKLKIPFFLTKYIGNVMKNDKFCECDNE